ncbi:MAG: hypothetical protein U0Q12_22020 [Vicinamibacterales bacterium]|mgnify:CR=1 FL=1
MAEASPPPQDEAPVAAARLVVLRNAQQDVGQREVYVYLDGEKIGMLTFGRKVTRDIVPGPHKLRAYNTLVSETVTFEALPGATITFVTGNRSAGCLLGWLMVIGAGPMGVFLVRHEARTSADDGPRPDAPAATD